AGNVLDALHQVDEVIRLARPYRREADAAIAKHGRGDAVPGGGRDERIPGRLTVVVGMDVDKTRRDDQPIGVDLPLARAELWPDCGDPSALHCDIGDAAGCTGAV